MQKTCGTTNKGFLEIPELSPDTNVSFNFLTYTDDSHTIIGYTNTGLWIGDQPGAYNNKQGKLFSKRGSAAGIATVSASGFGIFANVYPFSSTGSWCLNLTIAGIVIRRP